MAFGFDAHTVGLIVARDDLAGGLRRYLADFAAAYCDAADVVSTADANALASRARSADLLFALDAGYRELAAAIGASFVPCFPDPVLALTGERADDSEATLVEESPAAPLVRVCLFGPESTGKTTLAAALARHYSSVHATEYVRGYLDATGNAGTLADVPWIARGQRAAEIASARQATRVLVCDTNLATILLWSEVLFGDAPSWLRDEAMRQTYDVWLLTGIDVPFEPDPQRCFPHPGDRARLMAACEGMLARLGVVPVRLAGSHDLRMTDACIAIDRLLASSATHLASE
jgi:nicotinamide riboside kinase